MELSTQTFWRFIDGQVEIKRRKDTLRGDLVAVVVDGSKIRGRFSRAVAKRGFSESWVPTDEFTFEFDLDEFSVKNIHGRRILLYPWLLGEDVEYVLFIPPEGELVDI